MLSKEEILNIGLDFAMEFGKNWFQPINDRLKRSQTYLTESEIAEYNEICRKAMHHGHNFIYETLDKVDAEKLKIKNDELVLQFNLEMTDKFEWISNSNLKHLYSQSCYYAWKEGLTQVIT